MSNKFRVVIPIILIICFITAISNSSNIFAISNDTISIHLSKGYVDGRLAFFIATDSSDNQTAASINDSFGHRINFAPLLSSIPKLYIQQGYDFINGIKGEGPFGFQLPIASALPGDKYYSPLVQLNFIKWNKNANARLLKSSEEIGQAQRNNELQIIKTNIIINSPAVMQK
ncbi:MAG TPA: hypothetical protein VN703_00375 [Candidatus Sulfopaludibacter sp.]|jgi:hypothetical protein|nr:hypothetical protein [Candidatus Sulfopaludibacter sp.]